MLMTASSCLTGRVYSWEPRGPKEICIMIRRDDGEMEEQIGPREPVRQGENRIKLSCKRGCSRTAWVIALPNTPMEKHTYECSGCGPGSNSQVLNPIEQNEVDKLAGK